MSVKELNTVRELKKQIRDLEHHLQALRLSAQNITPILDGLPHSTEIKSRVEKLALRIVERDRELAALRDQLPHEQTHLVEIIFREVSDPTLQTLLILRYVDCCSFKETARRMKLTLRHVFRLHEKIFKCHIAAQNQS